MATMTSMSVPTSALNVAWSASNSFTFLMPFSWSIFTTILGGSGCVACVPLAAAPRHRCHRRNPPPPPTASCAASLAVHSCSHRVAAPAGGAPARAPPLPAPRGARRRLPRRRAVHRGRPACRRSTGVPRAGDRGRVAQTGGDGGRVPVPRAHQPDPLRRDRGQGDGDRGCGGRAQGPRARQVPRRCASAAMVWFSRSASASFASSLSLAARRSSISDWATAAAWDLTPSVAPFSSSAAPPTGTCSSSAAPSMGSFGQALLSYGFATGAGPSLDCVDSVLVHT
jgi:hypothetical protein